MNIFKLGAVWLAGIVSYIILANVYPAFTGLTDSAVVAVQASGNMSQQPGIVTGLQIMPLLVWFIPFGVIVAATVVYIRSGKN